MKDNKKPLVSILTTCYNGEKFIQRYIDTILNQTYENIELILINNGSTDRTEEIIQKNKEKLEQKCSKYIHIENEKNLGVGASINKGLKYFSGDYLTWPDSDDIMYPNCIEKKVEFLENNKQYQICFNPADIVYEDDLETIVGRQERIPEDYVNDTKIFEDLIFIKNVVFTPVTSFVRTEAFLKINPNREIYTSFAGQNWQMLLPMLYHYRCGYIKEPLAKFVDRKDSTTKNLNKDFLKYNRDLKNILINVVNNIKMPIKDKVKYLLLISVKYDYFYVRELLIRVFFIRKIKHFICENLCNKQGL